MYRFKYTQINANPKQLGVCNNSKGNINVNKTHMQNIIIRRVKY